MRPKYRADLPAPNSNGFGASLRETVMTYLGRLGDPLDRGITVRDLVESEIIQIDRRAWNGGVEPVPMTPGPSVEKKYEIDLTPPPTPEGFAVTPAISHVLITHSAPTYRQGHGHLRTRVYGVTITGPTPPTFSNAVELGQFSGTTWAMPSNPATTWRLWIKWETVDRELSRAPAGGTNGLLATTGQDVGKLLEALTGEITESQLYNALGERIDLIDGVGPGSVNARIQSEAQARAQGLLDEAQARGAAISAEETARQTADNSLSQQISTLTAAVNTQDASLAAAIQTEATARANADAAEAQARQTLAATVNSNTTAIQNEATARATADNSLSQQISTLTASVTGSANLLPNSGFDVDISGWESIWEQVPADDDGVVTRDLGAPDWLPTGMHSIGIGRQGIPQGVRDFGVWGTKIAIEPGARYCASAYLASHRCAASIILLFVGSDGSQQLSQHQSTPVDSAIGGTSLAGWYRHHVFATAPSNARFAWFVVRQTPNGGTNPYTWAVRPMLEVATPAQTSPSPWGPSVQGLHAALQVESQVRATQSGELFAKYTVKVDVNGYVSGFGLASTANNAAPFSDFAVRADRFYIANPSGPGIAPAMPFIVQTTPTTINGVAVPVGVYMNDAFIQNGTITNAKIADAAIDNAKIANLSADKLTAGSLAVGQHIQSSNYVPGVSGWRVNADGTAELNNVSVRGTVNAQSGQFSGAIVGASISGSVITGGTFQTAASGQRIVMDDKGILFLTGNSPGKYGTFKYGQRKYGSGVLVYFNSVDKKVPFYVAAEQNVADIHLYNRGANPTGGTYAGGDIICVNDRLKIFVPALGGWKTVALEP